MNALLGVILGGALFVPLSRAVGPLPAVLLAGALLVALILGEAWRAAGEPGRPMSRDRRRALARWEEWRLLESSTRGLIGAFPQVTHRRPGRLRRGGS